LVNLFKLKSTKNNITIGTIKLQINPPIKPSIVLFGLIRLTDTGAYIFGRLMGKHKLWPVISPNKTIEGFIGGLVTNNSNQIFKLKSTKNNITIGTIKLQINPPIKPLWSTWRFS
jgi:predicted CDP-diglyceride synthetase/phosphatidate cytidylyltransferase